MNYHQYCDVVQDKGTTGHELAQLGKIDLMGKWGMIVDHAAQFLDALKRDQKDAANDPDFIFGHARKESLLIRYYDRELGMRSILSSRACLPTDSKIQKMKSATDGEAFRKAGSNLPSEEGHRRKITNSDFRSGNEYSLGSMTISDNEDLCRFSKYEELNGGDRYLSDWPTFSDEKIAMFSTPQLKFPLSEDRADRRLSSSSQLIRSEDEEPLKHNYESEASTICAEKINGCCSSYEDSNESCKEPPKFEWSAYRISQKSDFHEEDDQKKKFNKPLSATTKSSAIFETTSTDSSLSELTLVKTPIGSIQETLKFSDRADSTDLTKKHGCSRNYGQSNIEYPLLSVRATEENLKDYQDLDDIVNALFRLPKGTTKSSTSSVLETAGVI